MADNSGGGTSAGTIASGILLAIFWLIILYFVWLGVVAFVSSRPAIAPGFQEMFTGGNTRQPNGPGGGRSRVIVTPNTYACPPGTADQTDWSATPTPLPGGGLRYPHVCR